MFYKQLNISVHKKVNSVHLGGNLIVGKIFDVEKYQKDRKVYLWRTWDCHLWRKTGNSSRTAIWIKLWKEILVYDDHKTTFSSLDWDSVILFQNLSGSVKRNIK